MSTAPTPPNSWPQEPRPYVPASAIAAADWSTITERAKHFMDAL
ncbi:hypothetical protein ACWCP8_40055 [Streptomyces sp. NPDC002206]